ncbi:hypothetical protein MBRA1_002525 [Malassezia brasiliensis]|uniref:SUN domain-containing protein n=1 Tax=Malassezia brasiliensis TaxID=1821822 RepID=A0AAF0DUA5_9BASI|nr:hypothetical protein MBRA1_002525 [Malassezia brasiliensis]
MVGRSVAAVVALVAGALSAYAATPGAVKVTPGASSAPRFAELPAGLTCVSPLAKALQQLDTSQPPRSQATVGSTALHDPRNSLIGDDILVCELPWNSAAAARAGGDSMHRVYAVLGTVLVPDAQAPPQTQELESSTMLERVPPKMPAQIADTTRDPLLSFAEWKEQHLENERQERARSKQREKQRQHARNDKHTDTGTGTTQDAHLLAQVAEELGAASDAARSAAAAPPPFVEQASRGTVRHSTEPSAVPEAGKAAHASAATSASGSAAASGAPTHTDASTATPVASAPPAPPPPAPPVVTAVENAPEALARLKHRWNYASLDCAAVLHQANPSAKFPTAILSEKKDRYMLSPCPVSNRERQFVVVELCQQVRIDTLVLANLEFFSSMFKLFSVRLSNDLHAPEHEWRTLGHFHARNVRGPQVFVLNSVPQSYYRFLRIDFLEHYGSEYYCPVSLLRVYGRNEREDADEADDVEDDEPDTVADEPEEDWEPPNACDIHVATIRGRVQMCPAHAASIWPCVCVPRVPLVPPVHPARPDAPRLEPSAAAPHPPPVASSAAHAARVSNTTHAANAPPANVTARADPKPGEKGTAGGESIFRTITKRLAALETNTSLSMQYLQLSSEVLRDRLASLEQTRHTHMTEFAAALNASYTQQLHTHLAELRVALQARDDAYGALATRVDHLATELVYERRRGFAQLLLLLILLALLVVTRASRPVLNLAQRPGDPRTTTEGVPTPRPRYASPLARVLSPLRRTTSPLEDESAVVTALEHAAHDMAHTEPRTPLARVQDAALPPRPVASVKYPHTRGAMTPSPGRLAWRTRPRLRAHPTPEARRPAASASAPPSGSEWSDGEESVHN